jgi:hypothetical protein
VTGEYSPESHLYDSPWYHESVKTYGSPSSDDIALAMEAQRRSKHGTKTKAMKDLLAVLTSKHTVSEESEVTITLDMPPTKHSPPKPASKVPEPVEIKETAPVKEKPKRKPRAKPSVVQPPAVSVIEELQKPVATTVAATIKLAENGDDPIEAKELIRIVLRTLVHNGKAYWRDGDREKLYEKTKHGGKGSYVGRWDSVSQSILREAPDTDEDE